MSLDFREIRPWNGSQNEAFEELCCQLAEYEQTPQGSKFFRKAPPDAGVECFWRLPNGDEWGWQAKFFLHPPNNNQWSQIGRSIKKALDKHPRLTAYTVCLPIDREDPRIRDQQWFMDEWNSHVEKWRQRAREKGLSVDFNYWGAHEFIERLSREEHRGRARFWFDEELFTLQWFESSVEEAVADAGPRYSPELNVDLGIARIFHGLGRTSEFIIQIKKWLGRTKKVYTSSFSSRAEQSAEEEFRHLQRNMNLLLSIVEGIEALNVDYIDWGMARRFTSEAMTSARDCIQKLTEKSAKLAEEQGTYEKSEDFGYERHLLYELIGKLNDFLNFSQSSEARLSNLPALLLVGDAGSGKTHLFCDVANQRVRSGIPTLLLLGGQFTNNEPWSQIISLLGLSCTKEEFLGALEAVAEASGARAIILIDALNEGEGRHLWDRFLAGMLTALSRYPWIGIAVSLRTSYEEILIPDGLVPNRLIRAVHQGFSDHEYEATRTFFDHFGIAHPSIPLIVPEFRNPLFLKLFCLGLRNRGLTRVPTGLRGTTAIFDFFIESVNEKLSKPLCLDFDPKSRIVQKAIQKLAKMMADRGSTWLSRDEAQTAVDSFLPREGYGNSLFRHMISEGILAEDRFRTENDEWTEGIHFLYDRFGDYLIAGHLLAENLDPENPSSSFQSDQPLGAFVKDEQACWRNRSLVEAFSIQIPERVGKELAEVIPDSAGYQPIREGFVNSLIWRDPKTITSATRDYINEHVIKYGDTHDKLLNTLLTVASNPDHPYNADFLHKSLMKRELAERDSWWSIFLHHQYQEQGAVDRLVEWAWSRESKQHIDDEPIRLCGIALGWFLATSNRFLRDRATKALVTLLTDRIHVLSQIIQAFLTVNDPYVIERLYAVAYGCAMRSSDNNAIGKLAKNVYEWVFKGDEPPPHILLRDYARGVLELALHRGVKLDIDEGKIRPPYKSEWPSTEIPTEEELKKYGEWRKDMPDEEKARLHLYHSVMGFGDFSRYIIGTNSGYFEWSNRCLDESRRPSPKERYEAFVQSLTKRQKEAWTRYNTARMKSDFVRHLEQSGRIEAFDGESSEELEIAVKAYDRSLRKTLGVRKMKTFEDYVIPYLDNPHADVERFDLSVAQRWILKRVFDLGWTVKLFGRFDTYINRYSYSGRGAHKPERIGKKYQWIAYHEFLARVADNFEFKGDLRPGRTARYEGPWQLSIRDIDPSCLLMKTMRETWPPYSETWWCPCSYTAWNSQPDDLMWLKESDDLPEVKRLIEITRTDSSKWLTLEAFYRWQQPTPPEEDRYDSPLREIWYMLKSYIVNKSDIDELYEWAEKQNFMGRWMPESHEFYRVFLGELYWAPPFEPHNEPSNDRDGWTRGEDNQIPKRLLVTADQYIQEYGGYDCSVDESLHVYTPAKSLVDGMGLHWNGLEGHFFDEKESLIAFDPSVRTVGPGALLIDRDALCRFLDENDYDIMWTILGEKNILGGRMAPYDWKGRLELSGAYRIRGGQIKGVTNASFQAPKVQKKSQGEPE